MRKSGKAAYYLVDLSDLPDRIANSIREDAAAGGGEYGVRIVEQVVNGAAASNIYGVYYDVPGDNGSNDDTKWKDAKEELGIAGSEVDDSSVLGEQGGDPTREAALRQVAEERAFAEAERIRSLEISEVEKIVNGETDDDAAAAAPAPVVNKANKAK